MAGIPSRPADDVMVRKLRSAFSILLALLLAGCADYVIDSDYTPEVNFTTLKT